MIGSATQAAAWIAVLLFLPGPPLDAAPEPVAPAEAGPRVTCYLQEMVMVRTDADTITAGPAPMKGTSTLSCSVWTTRMPAGRLALRIQGFPAEMVRILPDGLTAERHPDGVAVALPVDAPETRGLVNLMGPLEPLALPLPELRVERRVETLPDGQTRCSISVRAAAEAWLWFTGLPEGAVLDPEPHGPPPQRQPILQDCRAGKLFTATYRAEMPLVPTVRLSLMLPAEEPPAPPGPGKQHTLRLGRATVTLEAAAPFTLAGRRTRQVQIILSPRAQRRSAPPRALLILADMEDDTANWGLARDAESFKEGKSSGLWRAGEHPEAASILVPADWTEYPRLSFWVSSDPPLPGPLEVFVRADNPDTPEDDGYRARVPLPEAGWRQISLARNEFAAVGQPAGWDRISALCFRAPAGTPRAALLRLDDIRITRD